MIDHYRVLGIEMNATTAEVRRAWRRTALRTHPDHNPDDPHATVRFMAAREAYETLVDPVVRAAYDARREAFAPQRVVRTMLPMHGHWDRPRLDPVGAARYHAEQHALEAELGFLGHFDRQGLPRGVDLLDPAVRRVYKLRTGR